MAAAFNPAQPAPVKLGAADPVERWGRHTLEGNQAAERGAGIEARKAYNEALAVAEEMMVAAARAHDARAARFAPALYGISCNDIIALARAQDDGLTAGIFLCKLAGGYLAVMESAAAPASLRSRCVLHSRVASAALCAYFEERGMWDAAQTYTARANAAFFSVQRLETSAASRASNAAAPAPGAAPPAVPGPWALTWLDPTPALPDPTGVDAGNAAAAAVEPASPPTPQRRSPPPLPAGWGERASELPAAIWSDAEPALALTAPQPPPPRPLRARWLEWLARPFRRAPRASLPPLDSAARAK